MPSRTKRATIELIDAHMCPYQGRNYAHLVYRGNGTMLSVFAETAERGRLPLTHETPRKGFRDGRRRRPAATRCSSCPTARAPPPAVVNDLMRSTLAFVKTLER